MCNVQDCPKDGEDFHSTQCATYNKQPFQGWYLQWKPQKRLNDGKRSKIHYDIIVDFAKSRLSNSLPNDKVLDSSKFKAFADDKMNIT